MSYEDLEAPEAQYEELAVQKIWGGRKTYNIFTKIALVLFILLIFAIVIFFGIYLIGVLWAIILYYMRFKRMNEVRLSKGKEKKPFLFKKAFNQAKYSYVYVGMHYYKNKKYPNTPVLI
jgi:predicted membrane protein